MLVKDSKVKSEQTNIVLSCFFFTCNFTLVKEFTYLVFLVYIYFTTRNRTLVHGHQSSPNK